MVRVSSRPAACVAAALLLSSAAHAQPAPASAPAPSPPPAAAPVPPPAAAPIPPPAVTPIPVDPTIDLSPMPELGVDWPDPVKIDAAPTATGPTEVKGIAADKLQHYRVVLEGAETLGLTFRTRFDQLSALVTNQTKPANAAQINRRARDDEDLVRQLLAAQGRYDGRVVATVNSNPQSGDTIVHVTVKPGDAYTFATVSLPGLETTGKDAKRLTGDFGIKAGDPVNADSVLAAVTAFKVDLGRQGYPFAKVGEPEVAIDHQANKAVLTLQVTPGAHARFGRIVPTGTRPIFSASHLQTIARFHPGQPYDAARLDDFRRALIATGLVSTVTITPVATTDSGVVDIDVGIDRAPRRTVAAEVGYSTGEGVRVETSWTHRNLIQPEGAVTFRGVLGTKEQSLGATLRQGNFQARDRILTAQVVASHTIFDAYEARTFTTGASLERQTNIIWQKTWAWSFGGEFVATRERHTGDPNFKTYLVAATPTSLSYDGSDDLLNPTSGFRLSGRLSPELSLQSGAHAYVKTQIDASAYQPLGPRFVFAERVRFGSIDGVQRDSIAPSRRFYAGGGGSVRGYGYQKIGPVDQNGDPLGGRSLTEYSVEARVRFGNFGVVPFLDAGNLYSSSIPKLGGLRYGTGLGARYYSSFGPIRVDVGTPLNRRPGESRVAVYVSLGQAF
ncbi:MAG TPA: BamA/TamA family outer membrane protein [Sphingomonas sp.]|uniref:autotransporter assembly complex protein TamA n=1 Tax=Sphingomonas sp. TaxID=28214 RepID=UPI002B5C95B3|nr:BamA/TamA family outer membrane protein [Sphingomonas sp.]HMI19659.1 BamA/TamA family outer membrane protein [Sphingomonas sp.]